MINNLFNKKTEESGGCVEQNENVYKCKKLIIQYGYAYQLGEYK